VIKTYDEEVQAVLAERAAERIEMMRVEIPQAMMDAALDDEHGDDITILTNFVLEAGTMRRRQRAYVERGLKWLEGLTVRGVYLGAPDQLTFDTLEEGPITFLANNAMSFVNVWCITGADGACSKVVKVVCDGDDPEKRPSLPYYRHGYKWTLTFAHGGQARFWIAGGGGFESSKHPGFNLEHVAPLPTNAVTSDVKGRRT
jgi:hypothetical protein